MKNPVKNKVGRPSKQMDKAIAEAISILEVTGALSIGRMEKLKDLGFATKGAALAFISKRQRGLTGIALGNAVRQSHFPTINRTAVALRCIAEDGMPISLVARYFALDRRNLVRALPCYRKILEEEATAIARVEVSDAK